MGMRIERENVSEDVHVTGLTLHIVVVMISDVSVIVVVIVDVIVISSFA